MKKLVIWIVEDEPMNQLLAREALDRVKAQSSIAIETRSFNDWKWPSKTGADQPTTANTQLPDILILDLLEGNESFQGGAYYEELRRREQAAGKKERAAFVLIWTTHEGMLESSRFVAEKKNSDQRFIALGTKAKADLERAVIDCIGRIEEA